MDATVSVSKGCFVFKNGATRAAKSAKKSTKRKYNLGVSSLLGREVTEQPFYQAYAQTWYEFHTHLQRLQQDSYARTLEDLVAYIVNDCMGQNVDTYGLDEILPTAALLTGINQPDHLNQFDNLAQRLHEQATASVCVLQSRDCSNLKVAIETMVYNFIEAPASDENEDRDHKRLRRTQCTLKQLHTWYCNNFNTTTENMTGKRHGLVVILSDFECFSAAVLQDLILILSAHCSTLPFVLVLGVATSLTAIHSTLPYHVTSKIKLRVFKTQPAPEGLNQLLEEVLLSPKYSFHLSGKTFKFLTHIFLYYDFSIQGFIQGFKYCLMEHYFQGNTFALCRPYSSSLTLIKALTHDNIETIRRQLSFRPYVEGITDCKRIIAILTDDEYLKKKLPQLLKDCHMHFLTFRCFLEMLTILVADLPKCPLGKLKRELYVNCMSKDILIQNEFKECWQLLNFLSKDEFLTKMHKAITLTDTFVTQEILPLELGAECAARVQAALATLKQLLQTVVVATTNTQHEQNNTTAEMSLKELTSRHELKTRLLQLSKQDKPRSDFAKAIQNVLNYIQNDIVGKYLVPLQRAPPLYELFVFSDIATVRRNIIGAPRAALHTALNNPHFYLQCKCCELQEQTQLLNTMPDISVAYKLHLECGRLINLYDWLQAFRSVVDFHNEADDQQQQEQVDPQIQARFTRAVAELQFLGYIKMSKRKTDHATRLTW